jgi:hypothetical protein
MFLQIESNESPALCRQTNNSDDRLTDPRGLRARVASGRRIRSGGAHPAHFYLCPAA